MKTISSALIVLVLFSSALSQDQNEREQQPYETDLKGFLLEGGVVNLVEGRSVLLRAEAPPQQVQPHQALQNGDTIQTGQDGRIEVLLNPGSYLRLSANTQIAFVDLDPHNLTLTIDKGSALIEIAVVKPLLRTTWERDPSHSGYYDPLAVNFPQNESSVVAGGIYRFDVSAGGETKLKVSQGRAFFAGHRIENGMRATFHNGSVSFPKFSSDEADNFDKWSQTRGQALVKANQALKNSEWYRAMMKSRRNYIKFVHDQEDPRSRERHTVRALGGVAAFVQPGVFFRDETSEWKPLTPEENLKYGERIKTDAKGRAQIVVYATSWLFLAGDTEVVYGARSDGDAAIKVLRGSAIVITAYGEKEQEKRPALTFAAPQVEYEILRDGVYQLSANNNTSEMNVYSGRVRFAGREIHEDKRVVFRSDSLDIQRVSKRERDSLYVWSQKRLYPRTRDLRLWLQGVWCFDEATKNYTFVTGGFRYSSPYGGDYNVRLRRAR